MSFEILNQGRVDRRTKAYMNAYDKGEHKKYYIGRDEKFRFLNQDSYIKTLTEPQAMYECVLYPLYINGKLEVKRDAIGIILELINSDDPIEFYQAMQFLITEQHMIERWADIPFVIFDKYMAKLLFERLPHMKDKLIECQEGDFAKCQKTMYEMVVETMIKNEFFTKVKKEFFIENTEHIVSKVSKNILNGIKIPHKISQPVIYKAHKNSSIYYLAFFAFFYNDEEIKAGIIERPTVWAKVDVITGDIIEEYETKDIEFSDASYDIKYNVRTNDQYDTSKKYYEDTFSMLDDVRYKLINENKFDMEKYSLYLEKIIANIPKEYKRFYTDLSV